MENILALAGALSFWTVKHAWSAEESGPGLIGDSFDLGTAVGSSPTIAAHQKNFPRGHDR